MRIGVMTFTTPWGGGAFQYESLVLDALARLHKSNRHVVEYLFMSALWSNFAWLGTGEVTLRGIPLKLAYEPFELAREIFGALGDAAGGGLSPDLVRLVQHRASAKGVDEADWLFMTAPTELGQMAGKPYVMPIHDLQHRLQQHFPEVSDDGEFNRREFLYRNACRGATMILVDSEVGKEDVLACYGDVIEPDRISVVPFAPAIATDSVTDPATLAEVRARYHLPERFFFYPAQFWQHKNHLRIVEALSLIADKFGTAPAIAFTSTAADNNQKAAYEALLRRIADLDLSAQVHFLGYLPAEDLAPLYSQAVALVMPTFFGPTNIPVLEAWSCGCPVITSDIRGVRDQAGDAALLVDPNSVEAIAGAMARVWSDEALRQDLIRRGHARSHDLAQYDFHARIDDVVEEMCARVASARTPSAHGFS